MKSEPANSRTSAVVIGDDPYTDANLNWRSPLVLAAVVTSLIWIYLAVRFWQVEPRWTSVVLAVLAVSLAVLFCIRKLWAGRASLRMLVIGGPILGALLCMPIRMVTQNLHLASQLNQARVSNYGLGHHGQVSAWLRNVVLQAVGSQFAEYFNTDLTSLRVQMEVVDLDQLRQLPTQHLRSVSFRRYEAAEARLDDTTVAWLNTIPTDPLISLRLRNPSPDELSALSALKHTTMLKLNRWRVAGNSLELPAVYDLEISDSDLTKTAGQFNYDLPAIERFHLNNCQLTNCPTLLDSLAHSRHVAVAGCRLDDALLAHILDLPVNDLKLTDVSIPDGLRFGTHSQRVGRSLTLWNCSIDGDQLVALLERRQPRAIQLDIKQPLSVDQLSQILRMSGLRFARFRAVWATREHLMAVTETQQRMRVIVLDSMLNTDDMNWLIENKGPNVSLYFQQGPTGPT